MRHDRVGPRDSAFMSHFAWSNQIKATKTVLDGQSLVVTPGAVELPPKGTATGSFGGPVISRRST